jgi:hypothetical protein
VPRGTGDSAAAVDDVDDVDDDVAEVIAGEASPLRISPPKVSAAFSRINLNQSRPVLFAVH